MNATDIGHDRGWLDAPAAASLARVDADLGRPLGVNSAGRTYAEQQDAYRKYLNGTGAFAARPGTSPHEFGNAIDTDDRFTWLLGQHGWSRPLSFEPWHFVYYPRDDQHIGRPAGIPAGIPEEEDMPLTDDDLNRIAKAVHNYKMHGGAKNGNEVPAETAGARLRNIRRSTHGAKASLTAIRAQLALLIETLIPGIERRLDAIEAARAGDLAAEDEASDERDPSDT